MCSVISSVMCMLLLSLQRVIQIKCLETSRSSLFSPTKVISFMVTLWILLVSFQLLPAFKIWGRIGHREGAPYCSIWKKDEGDLFFPDMIIHILGYPLPLLALIISSCLIHKQLNDNAFRTGREGQVTKSALLMIGSFVLIFTPGMMDFLFNKLSEGGNPNFTALAFILSWSHGFINPFISFFCNSYFRQETIRVLTCQKEEYGKRFSRASTRRIISSRSSSSDLNKIPRILSISPGAWV